MDQEQKTKITDAIATFEKAIASLEELEVAYDKCMTDLQDNVEEVPLGDIGGEVQSELDDVDEDDEESSDNAESLTAAVENITNAETEIESFFDKLDTAKGTIDGLKDDLQNAVDYLKKTQEK